MKLNSKVQRAPKGKKKQCGERRDEQRLDQKTQQRQEHTIYKLFFKNLGSRLSLVHALVGNQAGPGSS